MKCSLCGEKIRTTILGKLVGTTIKKPGTKKIYYLCNRCQPKLHKHGKNLIIEIIEGKKTIDNITKRKNG